MLISPAHIGALGARQGIGVAPPAGPSIAISPHDPPTFTSLPATWTPTVTVTGITPVKWAVFQVSATNPPNYTSAMGYQVVNIPGGTGSFVPNASMTSVRDILVVKNIDESIQDVSGPTTVNAQPPPETGGAAMARAFISDLTLGLNIERGAIIFNGMMTTARFQQYKDTGVTHIRFFPPIGGIMGHNYPSNVAGGDLDWMFEACERAMGVGHKILLDLMDVCGPEHLVDGRIPPYLNACGARIASRDWDVNKFCVGAVNEYAGATNAEHRAKMHEFTAILRSQLPGRLLLCASADWGDPGTLTNGSFVPPPDDRILVQWHKYDHNADDISGPSWRQQQVSEWAAQTGLVTICGEYGIWEDDFFPDPARFAGMIDAAARGMGQQRPTFWTITDGGASRFNQGSGTSSSELLPGLPEAFAAGDAHIRAQGWFQGGGQVPTGNQVTRLQVFHRGQSNAVWAKEYGGDNRLRDTLAGLTQLPVDMISRAGTADDSNIHSGTSSYFDPGSNYEASWLDTGQNFASSPSGWGNRSPMTHTLTAVSRYTSSDQSIPLLDFQVHWEYDLGIYYEEARAVYRQGHWEVTKRIRDARPKAAGKHISFLGYCPYEYGNWAALEHINNAWVADLADSSRNVHMACGMMMDGEPNTQYSPEGDYFHWGAGSGPRIYPRVAFRMAKYCYDRGWLPSNVNLGDCPSMGPAIQSASRSGNSINLVIAHDKGSALATGQDGVDWRTFTASASDGSSHLEATGGAITGANAIRVDFPSAPSTNGLLWHAHNPRFFRRQVVRDNWHSTRPSKYGSVPHVDVVDFPLQRTMQGVAYGADLGGGGGGGTPTPTEVDAEYAVYSGGSPLAVGKSGVLYHGQSNMGFLLSEGVWHVNTGLAQALGVPNGRYNPQLNGISDLDAYGLNAGAKSNPEIYSVVGGVGLFSAGQPLNGGFMQPNFGSHASTWSYGPAGFATQRFIQQLMTSNERSICYGVFNFHSENDCSDLNDSHYDDYLNARLNFMAKVRADMGRQATGQNGLPWFFVYPIPFSGNGQAMVRKAWHNIISNPLNNAHLVVAQTCDSAGGLRYGATTRDYSHRATEDLLNYARRAVFGIVRVLNSQRGVGSRNLPSFGPKVKHAYAESGTTTLLTIAHDRGDTLSLGSGAGDGRGWTITDNGSSRSVSGVAIVGGNQLRLTHASASTSNREVGYCIHGQELGQGGGIYDNYASKPNPAGWPSNMAAELKFNWPVRGFLVPMAVSTTPL